jgi:4-amino-4-deoxy-L-arabinose transferase-like glycosyltransferase
MALGSRDILFFFMGIIAVCLVVSFSAYELTTYESVRGVLGNIVADTSQGGSLHSQYNDMVDQFSNSRGDVFTYHYGDQSIDVTASQARSKSESQVIGMVLDKYAVNFYNGNVKGNLATASGVAGAEANGFYFLATVLLFAVFLIIFILSYIQKWYESTRDLLKSAGKVLLAMGIVAFIVFLFMPSVVKSVMWASISSDLGRDITYVVEPRITGTFLVNTLIVILLGALSYGAGFLIHINTGEGEPNPMEYLKSAPKMRTMDSQPKTHSTLVARGPSDKPGRRQL